MLFTVTFGGVKHCCLEWLGTVSASRNIYTTCARRTSIRMLAYHGQTYTRKMVIHSYDAHGVSSYSAVFCMQEHWTNVAKCPRAQALYQQAACFCVSSRLSANKMVDGRVPSRVAPPKYLISRKWARRVIERLHEVSDLTEPGTIVYDCTPGEQYYIIRR